MTREELSRNYWRYYRMLEDKFLATTNYVEVALTNFSSFSNEYALLIQSIGAELDNFFKVYCRYNPTDRKNIADYANFILAEYTSITTQKIKVLGTDIELIPFQRWNVAAPAQSLFWWSAFDKIKHNRHGNFSDANQKNVLNMLAALYLLEMKQFGKVAKESNGHLVEPDSPDEGSKLFSLPEWSFRYIRVGEFFAVVDGAFCQIVDDE